MMIRPASATALFLGVLLVSGCGATRQAVDTSAPESPGLQQMNAQLEGETAVVIFIDGRTETVRNVSVGPVSTSWQAFRTREPRGTATDSIHAIEAGVFKTPAVARMGFALGFAAGFVATEIALGLADTGLSSPVEILISGGVGLVAGFLGTRYEEQNRSEWNDTGRFILNPRRRGTGQ